MPGSRYAIQGKDNSGLLGGMMKTGPRASPKAPNHLCYELNVAFIRVTEELALRRSLPEDARLGACGRGYTRGRHVAPEATGEEGARAFCLIREL